MILNVYKMRQTFCLQNSKHRVCINNDLKKKFNKNYCIIINDKLIDVYDIYSLI